MFVLPWNELFLCNTYTQVPLHLTGHVMLATVVLRKGAS